MEGTNKCIKRMQACNSHSSFTRRMSSSTDIHMNICSFALPHHSFDVDQGLDRTRHNRDALCVSGGFLRCNDGQDTVGVNLEGQLDPALAFGGAGDAGEEQLAKQMVVLSHRLLALVYFEEYHCLVVDDSHVDSRFLDGDGRVSCHDAHESA
mmetsp:Transcript_8987/g.25893  ORF Transcript_8987/g.25893 Transcript_8987/m.25893 type:complete len:152 (+) Transcript_8987:308-763(+)